MVLVAGTCSTATNDVGTVRSVPLGHVVGGVQENATTTDIMSDRIATRPSNHRSPAEHDGPYSKPWRLGGAFTLERAGTG